MNDEKEYLSPVIKVFSGSDDEYAEILRIENESFSDPWTRRMFSDAYGSECSVFYTAYAGDVMCGYAVFSIFSPEAEILSIAVAKKYRMCGIARLLIEKFLGDCKASGVYDVYLEVRRSNAAAISLYEKYGFVSVGVRRNYYRLPKEDAFVMHKEM